MTPGLLIDFATAVFALGAIFGGTIVVLVAVCAPRRFPALFEDTPENGGSE